MRGEDVGGEREDGWTSVELVIEADGCPARGKDGEHGRGGWRARSGRTVSTVGDSE